MGWARHIDSMGDVEIHDTFGLPNLKSGYHVEDLSVDGMLIINDY
jgi:hypothetical protein